MNIVRQVIHKEQYIFTYLENFFDLRIIRY